MFDVHDCIGFLTNHGAKAVGEAMNQQFKKKDLTRVQWMALYYIDQKGAMTQKELAAAMMIDPPGGLRRKLPGEAALPHREGEGGLGRAVPAGGAVQPPGHPGHLPPGPGDV